MPAGLTPVFGDENHAPRRLRRRAILDVHCTTSRPHDTKIGWQVLRRTLHRIETITVDKGYDASELRDNLRSNGMRPVVKLREFGSLDNAHNARLDDDVSHQ